MTVRRAEFNDVGWLIEQVRAFEKFAGYKRPLFLEADAHRQFGVLIEHQLVLIATNGAERLGFIAGVFTKHHFNANLTVLAELLWWVQPEHRGSRAVVMLLREFERIGREKADWVVFSLEHNSPFRDEHLTKRGFRMMEKSYLLEV